MDLLSASLGEAAVSMWRAQAGPLSLLFPLCEFVKDGGASVHDEMDQAVHVSSIHLMKEDRHPVLFHLVPVVF